jgi:hypothetical protein
MLARIVVVPAGVIVLLGLCNPPRQGVNSRPNLGRSDDKCTPYVDSLLWNIPPGVTKQSRLHIGCNRNTR